MTQLELTFLGTAGTMPSPERNVSALALRYGDELLLLDCGEGTQRQLMRSQLSFMRITRIFLSHLHGDHYYGMPGLLSTMKMNERERPLDVYVPSGAKGRLQELLGAHRKDLGYELRIHEVEPGATIEAEGFRMRCTRTDHRILCLAWSFEEDERPGRFDRPKAIELGVPVGPLFGKLQWGEAIDVDGRTIEPSQVVGPSRQGRKIVYSSDTRPSDAVAALARGADILIHDSTVATEDEALGNEYGHSSARQAGTVATDAGARQLILTHISGRYKDSAPLVEQARSTFEGPVRFAEDLLVVDVAMPPDPSKA